MRGAWIYEREKGGEGERENNHLPRTLSPFLPLSLSELKPCRY